ncbi:hypothetical protein [Sphingomonas sp. NIC1]|uniref:hypothetical protein n=1 Tax=Sphingomonas sp. NIC1 TaxID=1961362 RepID=UPI0007C0EA0B|nr:hypothetical protein [Sphingomonas sp. NIC1]ANC85469.1 hypothetical protein A7E77_00280 [Sphingomonas sp. NIC1]
MTWQHALSIALAVAAANLTFQYLARFRAWKAKRTEIPAYRNWRGEYVPDLHFIRMKRAFIASWVVFVLVSAVWGYFIIMDASGQRPY